MKISTFINFSNHKIKVRLNFSAKWIYCLRKSTCVRPIIQDVPQKTQVVVQITVQRAKKF